VLFLSDGTLLTGGPGGIKRWKFFGGSQEKGQTTTVRDGNDSNGGEDGDDGDDGEGTLSGWIQIQYFGKRSRDVKRMIQFDSNTIISSTRDDTLVEIWNLLDETRRRCIWTRSDIFCLLRVHPSILLMGSVDQIDVVHIDFSTSTSSSSSSSTALPKQQRYVIRGHSGMVVALCELQCGEIVSAAADGLRFWKDLHKIQNRRQTCIRFFPTCRIADNDGIGVKVEVRHIVELDESSIATYDSDGTITVWRIKDGSQLRRMRAHGKPYPNGYTLLTGECLLLMHNKMFLASAYGDSLNIYSSLNGELMASCRISCASTSSSDSSESDENVHICSLTSWNDRSLIVGLSNGTVEIYGVEAR